MPTMRTERLGRLFQEKIGALIVEGKIKDPRVDTFLSVTRVDIARDLSFADVFVSSFKTEGGIRKGVEGLQSAAGFIQSQLAPVLHIRKTPRLRFHADTAMKTGFDLIKKIESLTAAPIPASEPPESPAPALANDPPESPDAAAII